MPKKPGNPEANAPIKKDTDTSQEFLPSGAKKANRTATTTTKIGKTLYSARRKAMAPSAMCFTNFFHSICSLVLFIYPTCFSKMKTTFANKPDKRTKYIFSILFFPLVKFIH